MAQSDVDERLGKIILRRRLAVLQAIVQSEGALDRAYGRAVRALQRRLKRTPRERVQREVLRKMRQIVDEIEPILERSIKQGTVQGNQTAIEQFRAVFRGESIGGFEFLSVAAQNAIARQTIQGTLTVDKVSLSSRLWEGHRQRGLRMAEQITATLRAGESLTEIADRLIALNPQGDFAGEPPSVRIPRYIRELRDAAKQAVESGQKNILAEAVAKHAKQIDDLGQARGFAQTLRPVSKQFVKEIQNAATPEQIDAHVERWVLDKQRRHTRTIARTESARAYRESYERATRDKPYVKGYRWVLSSAHPEPDVCDVLANQDLHGLGPGGYPVDRVPETPHPNDLCYQVTIVDEDHFERELAKRNPERREPPKPWLSGKRETGAEWLEKQPEGFKRKLLGPTKAEIFKKKPSAVISRQGVPRSAAEAVRRNRQ